MQRFIRSQQGKVVDLSVAALGVAGAGVVGAAVHLLPRRRRAEVAAGDLQPAAPGPAATGARARGSWRSTRPVATSTRGPCSPGCRRSSTGWCFQAIGIQAPVAHGAVGRRRSASSCRWSARTSPVRCRCWWRSSTRRRKALVVLIFVVLYQQIENYFLLPRITARTMDLHPAVAFGSAIAGAAVLGAVGAILAIPAAAMAQAVLSNVGERHEVIDSHLTTTRARQARRRRRSRPQARPRAAAPMATPDDVRPRRHHPPQRVRRVGALRRGGRPRRRPGEVEFAVGDPAAVDLPAIVEQADAGGGDGARRTCACHPSCSRWCAPATTARPCISTACGGSSPPPVSTSSRSPTPPDLPLDEAAAEAVLRRWRRTHAAADELQRQAQRDAGHVRASTVGRHDAGYLSSRASAAAAHHRHDRRACRRAAQPTSGSTGAARRRM